MSFAPSRAVSANNLRLRKASNTALHSSSTIGEGLKQQQPPKKGIMRNSTQKSNKSIKNNKAALIMSNSMKSVDSR